MHLHIARKADVAQYPFGRFETEHDGTAIGEEDGHELWSAGKQQARILLG